MIGQIWSRGVALISIVVTLLPAFAAGPPIVFSKTDLVPGTHAGAIAVGDFNNDHITDIAYIPVSGGIAILLGKADGSFQSPIVSAGTGLYTLAVADFDKDGNLDLITFDGTNFFGAQVLLGNGDGTFKPPLYSIPLGSFNDVTVGDFDGDGKIDLAAADYSQAFVRISLGNGDGTFRTATNYRIGNGPGLTGTARVAVADLNADNKLDVVAVNYLAGTVSVLLGNGDGSFRMPVDYAAGELARDGSIAIGDLNHDGRLDIVVGQQSSVGVFLGNGDGTLQPVRLNSLNGHTDGVAIGDLNGDGIPDIVATADASQSGTDYLYAFSGNGDGTFGTSFKTAVGSSPRFLVMGDFDKDGRPDLVTAYNSNAGLSVLLRGPDFVPYTVTSSPAGLTISVDGAAPCKTPCLFNFSPGTDHTIATVSPQTLVAGAQAVFAAWSDLGIQTHHITVSGSAATFTASFKTQYQLNTGVSPALGGAVSPASGLFYDSGATVPLQANPGPGYRFSSWDGPVVSTTFLATVIMDAPKSVTAIFTSTSVAPPSGLLFFPLPPCRVSDTRNEMGILGGPRPAAGETRNIPVPFSQCSVPFNASAYSLNVTVVPNGPLSYLTLWPTGQQQPIVSTLNSGDGRVKANAAIVPAGANGSVSVFVTGESDVIVDINGYFAPASVANGLAFYPAAPCRIADTRNPSGAFGGPFLAAGQTRTILPSQSLCNLPAASQAFSLNVTTIPKAQLGFLSIWPFGQGQPLVSTLNSPTGGVVANAAIVPSGINSGVNFYATDASDLALDINGYFAAPGGPGALSFYPVSPCRVSDTRLPTGALGGPRLAGNASRAIPITASACGIPSTAQAYSLNATVVPAAALGYLTLWPANEIQPLVSTLNSPDRSIVANAAIVPAGQFGQVSAFVTDATDLILDINGYFAP